MALLLWTGSAGRWAAVTGALPPRLAQAALPIAGEGVVALPLAGFGAGAPRGSVDETRWSVRGPDWPSRLALPVWQILFSRAIAPSGSAVHLFPLTQRDHSRNGPHWPGVYTFGQAGVITVTATGFVADISLPTGRAIAGQVVAQDTGEPVEGALLMARIAEAPWAEPAGRFEPGSAPGRFEITGLPPVPIRLHVQVPQGSPFLGDGYWSDSALETGRRVDAPGDVRGLVIRLPRGGEVSGTVRDGLGHPVAGAAVRIENCQYGCPREAISDASGDYRIRGIPPSDRLIARAAAPGVIDQWFAGANDWIKATEFALGPGEVRAGVDFVLVGGGVLVGRVIAGDTGQPLTEVAAYVESVVDPGRRWFADVTGEAAGTFRIGPVPPDTYRLVLLPSSRRSSYWPARWLTSTGIDTSGVIRLDPGQEVEVEVRLARTRTARESDTFGAAGASPRCGRLWPSPPPPPIPSSAPSFNLPT